MKIFSNRLWITFCLAVQMAVLPNAYAESLALPAGWRLPNPDELSDAWRAKDPARYARAIGDFDGDGRPDRAAMLVSLRRQRLALFAYSAAGNQKYAWRKLNEVSGAQGIHAMGIEVVPPGKYTTACGKAYDTCKYGEPKTIRALNPLINYFKSESANRYVYFDSGSRMFRLVWMSD